ncbi:MAG TPA: SUMF1/EgtB/PvdO family nonheme iron enzyme [Rudaea sp.]
MPGSDVVQKQSVLGGAAGIALLAFALAYRFFPSGGRHEPVAVPSESASSVAHAPPPIVAQPPRVTSAPPAPAKPAPVETIDPATLPGPPPPPPPKAIAALLKKADKALADGQFLEPKDANAYALYRQVLDADPNNAAAKAGIGKVRDAIVKQAGEALDVGDEGESARLVAALATLPNPGDELAALQARLKVLREVNPLLSRAAELLKDNHAIEPEGGSALDVYRQVMRLDPGNKLADQGLAQIERTYLDRALAAAAQDDFGGADQILGEASSVRPGSHELLDARTRIEGIRRSRATNVMAQASSALDANNPDLAQLLAQKALGLSPDLPGIDEFNERLRNARLYASYKPGQVFADPFLDRSGRAPAVVVIPTGSFTMGSPANEEGHRASEEPQREVKISTGFALGRADVTVAEFRQFVEDSGYSTDADKLGTSSVYDEDSGRMIEKRGANWRSDYLGATAQDNMPVINISWNDASAYAKWLSTRTGKQYRLPSEAEFEYTLRAGSTTRYWWGNGYPAAVVANLTGDGERSPHARRSWSNAFPRYNDKYWGPSPGGAFPANKLGLLDIDGNVSVWVDDCWHDNYTRAPADSRAWVNPGCAEHVIRGGSWGSAPDQVRSAFRLAAPSETRSARVGVRVARDL